MKSFIAAALAILLLPAVNTANGQPGLEIEAAENATHIVRITQDTLQLVVGSTYSFTVDSPANLGPVSTGVGADLLPKQIKSKTTAKQNYRVVNRDGKVKPDGEVVTSDRLVVESDGQSKFYRIETLSMALSGRLHIENPEITVNAERELTLFYTAGQRSPRAKIEIQIPPGIRVTMANTTVDVIGRGSVKLRDLATQSIGRTGTGYPYSKVGQVEITGSPEIGSVLHFTGLDLRPANGPDLKLNIAGVRLAKSGSLVFSAKYTTAEPKVLTSAGVGSESATLSVVETISETRTSARFHTGQQDVKSFGVVGDGKKDDTEAINSAIARLADAGGGTLRFSSGTYMVRTIHLRSHVYLFLDREATIKALPNGDAPEATWFSDRDYRTGLSPTDRGPYLNPENWLTKQDAGHTYFQNAMFTAERMDDIKIIGNGRITGNGNLLEGNVVIAGPPDKRSDKMFSFKLCTNIEIGGLRREGDLWYDPEKDEPHYIMKNGEKNHDVSNMLQIDQGGHFVLLATGTDGISVHDIYFAKHSAQHARDVFDFMGCRDVSVMNIYSRVSSDDIVKLGSDSSLGFTRKSSNFRIRNIIGDTHCNLFQIGSETADDISDVHVDNIYVLGSNKAGFSISTNDGATVSDIHLNCGHTGPIHSRSKMFRATAPFFISISNRGRVLGSTVKQYSFIENGQTRNELLCKNVNIGSIENVTLNSIDIQQVYSGSSYKKKRWEPYDGSQQRATPIVAGYALPDSSAVEGGLDFTLPNGNYVGRIKNITFNDVRILVKGGNPLEDRKQSPRELGVGQYNVPDLGIQPAYGLWVRHAENLNIKDSEFNHETPDQRYAIFLDDVIGAHLDSVTLVRANDDDQGIAMKKSRDVNIGELLSYGMTWGNLPEKISHIEQVGDEKKQNSTAIKAAD